MQNKLQELTDKLYAEGLSRGKQEGEELLKKAKTDAEQIVNKAKTDAERIIAEAQKQAEELKLKAEADVKMATTQSIAAIKQEIEKLIVTQIVTQPIEKALSADEFTKSLISAIVNAFNPAKSEPVDLDIILPESVKKSVEPFIRNEINKQLSASITVDYDKKLNAGFKISPKNAGYTLQFTDDEFSKLIASYLRPAAKKILFG